MIRDEFFLIKKKFFPPNVLATNLEKKHTQLFYVLDIMATLGELPSDLWPSWSEQEKGLWASVPWKSTSGDKWQRALVTVLSTINAEGLQTEPSLGYSWGTKGRYGRLLRLEGCTVSGQWGGSPTINQPKCVLLCLCSDWRKQSEEN